MALTAGKTLLGTINIDSCNQVKLGSSNVTRMFVGETIIFPWNVTSLTGIKYNSNTQASLCGGNGDASELHWVDCSSLDVGDYVWTNSGRTTLAATGWYGTGGAGSAVYYVNPAGVVSSIGTCPTCVCLEGFQLSNSITVSCDDASGLNGRVTIIVRSILCNLFQVRLISLNGLIQTPWVHGSNGGNPSALIPFTFTGIDDGTYRVQMAERNNESCSTIFTLSNINVNCFVPTPTPTNTPTPTPTSTPLPTFTFRTYIIYDVDNNCNLSPIDVGFTKNEAASTGYYFISNYNPGTRYYLQLTNTYDATSDPVGLVYLNGLVITSCTPPVIPPTPTPTSTPLPTLTPTPTPSPTPCPDYGTYIGEFCGSGPEFNKIGIFADGNCGTYTSVIAENDPACGYVPPPTPTPTNTPPPPPTPTPTPTFAPTCYTWYNYQGYDIYIDFVDCGGTTQNGYFVYDGGSVCAQIMYSSTMDSSFTTC
jgi:hypothetical protein